MWQDLKKLKEEGWAVDDADIKLRSMISQASDLQSIPAKHRVLRKATIKNLYRSICGEEHPMRVRRQTART